MDNSTAPIIRKDYIKFTFAFNQHMFRPIKSKIYYQKHRVKIQEHCANYYQSHKEQAAINGKKRYEIHKEEKLTAHKQYYQLHKTELREKNIIYRETNKVRLAANRLIHKDNRIKYEQAHKVERSEYARKRNLKFKLDALTHYGKDGKPACVKCGYNENINGLALDHINGDGGVHRHISKDALYHWLALHNYPDGLQTLCGTCHLIKSVEYDRRKEKKCE